MMKTLDIAPHAIWTMWWLSSAVMNRRPSSRLVVSLEPGADAIQNRRDLRAEDY